MTTWSTEYARKVKNIVQTGIFCHEGATAKSSTPAGKMDKKEVSVWKLSDNVSKPDFRHWLDAIDLHLEAIHDFSNPTSCCRRSSAS